MAAKRRRRAAHRASGNGRLSGWRPTEQAMRQYAGYTRSHPDTDARAAADAHPPALPAAAPSPSLPAPDHQPLTPTQWDWLLQQVAEKGGYEAATMDYWLRSLRRYHQPEATYGI